MKVNEPPKPSLAPCQQAAKSNVSRTVSSAM